MREAVRRALEDEPLGLTRYLYILCMYICMYVLFRVHPPLCILQGAMREAMRRALEDEPLGLTRYIYILCMYICVYVLFRVYPPLCILQGAMREAVRRALEEEPLVARFEDAPEAEGGSGCTIAYLN